ncbi:MAG: hypothetical protein ACYDCC_11260 [Actinomycetota bacterium]
MRRAVFGITAFVLIVSVTTASAKPKRSSIAPSLKFTTNTKASPTGAGFSEPSGITSSDGTRYVAYQGNGSNVSRADRGKAWVNTGFGSFDQARGQQDGDAGDVTMAADNAGTVFVGHLGGALQTDIDYTRDGGSTWTTATSVIGRKDNTSTQPLMVDRPWIATYSPSTNAADTKLYVEYHDFWDPDAIWMIACSMATGTLTCGAGTPVSGQESACNTIPGPMAVAPPGSPHAGRVYAAWVTADPATNATTGCNTTQMSPYFNVYTAYSDNADATKPTWKVQPVFLGPKDAACAGHVPTTGSCDDNGNLFPHLTIDRAGNVYVAWVGYISSIDPHYDVYLSVSTDGGDTWNGDSTGAGAPIRVNREAGMEVMPAVVAGDSGRIALAWVGTSFDSQPYLATDTCPMNTPPELSCAGKPKPQAPDSAWYTYVAQSTDATSSHPHFNIVRVSDKIIHYGDYCTLGIYCDGSSTGNRSLLDAITIFLDAGGYVQVAWTDQREGATDKADAAKSNADKLQSAYDEIYTACQSSGPSLYLHPTEGPSCTKVLAMKIVRHKKKH